MDIQKHTIGNLTYYLSHPHPSVLILSGMHGDEYGTGRILEHLFDQGNLKLPPFLYIPQISPSAVGGGTRKNMYGHDINRQFLGDSQDAEAQTVMQLLGAYHFTYVIDIHEDPDRTRGVYLYDTGIMSAEKRNQYEQLIRELGATPYTGIDDEEDKELGCSIDRGYYTFRAQDVSLDVGFLSIWLEYHKIAERVFTVEIPGKAPTALKRKLLLSLLPLLSRV